MAEHHVLVAEMTNLEQMGTQERQKLAKKRRLQQLKKWGQREKEWIAKEKQLNKRLANMMQEENNGLNLKQYTTYSSSHRSKKKQQQQLHLANGKNKPTLVHNNNIHNNNNNNEYLNGNLLASLNDGPNRLVPSGRVHFNVGVMLLEAAARNDFEEVKRLLMLGVSPDSVNHDGLTALHQCCIDASEPMMNLLLEFGANVDARDTEQWTPLHAACTCGHLNLVKILVDHGANLLAVNGDGNMPFDICEDESTLDYIESQMVKRGITQEMIDYTRASCELQMLNDLERQVAQSGGSDLDAKNETGVTQLHVAAANGYLTVVEFLIKHGANVNACDNDQWRPLHGLACWGNEQHIKVAELLVEAGAQLEARTANDETVFDLCDNVELLERLNQLKDELESKQKDSGTDRLRRTQSRTNSRVHSVRRTSVRDKNQISRREAREEALLRVENSPTATTANAAATTTMALSDSTTTNGLEQTTRPTSSMENNGAAVPRRSSKEILDSEKVPPEVQKAIENIKPPSSSNNNNMDKVDGGESDGPHTVRPRQTTANNDNAHEQPQQTNIDDVVAAVALDDDSQQQNDMTNQNDRSQAASDDSIPQSAAATAAVAPASNRRKQFVKQAQVSYSVSSSNLLGGDGGNPRAPVTGAIPLNVTGSKSASRLNGLGDSGNGRLVVTNTINTGNNEQIPIDAHYAGTNNGDDPVGNQCNQPNGLPLTPINYTLSNLKKQRSDLRMRTTSIGGSSGSNGAQQQVAMDPQPPDVGLQNGHHHRPESPSSTFRKFRGEPSELIGGGDKGNRRKCCILI